MKFLFICAAVLVCVLAVDAKHLNSKIECFHRNTKEARIGEGAIRDLLEKLRDALKKNFDPVDLKDKHIAVNNDMLNLDATITAHSEGAAGFEIKKIDISIIALTLKVELLWPSISLNGLYDLTLNSSALPQSVYGKGKLDVVLKNLGFNLVGKVSLLKPTEFKKLTIDLSLDDLSFEITGIMNDEELSKQISEKISTELPKRIEEINDIINKYVEKYREMINDIINKKKLFDSIDFPALTAKYIDCGGY